MALGAVVALSVQGVAAGGPLTETGRAAGPYEAAAVAVNGQDGQDGQDGPVRSRVHRLALAGTGEGRAALAKRGTEEFGLLGVSWNDDRTAPDGLIQARTRSAETGAWSDWIELEPYKPGLDGDRPGARGATEPVWVGASDGAEVRVNDPSGELPAGLRLDLVDPGTAEAPATARTAARTGAASDAVDPGPPSTVPQPPVVNRAGWGADESLNTEGPIYLPENNPVKAVFVHHTTDGAYDCAQSAAVVRAMHVYHVKTNGWRDLGYNFLVDKCGTVFEGRQGGIDQPVMGAHTYGFNAESSSVAIIGDYTSAEAPDAALTAAARIAAYKLGQYGGDPAGTVSLVAGATQKNYAGRQFTAGQSYTFDRISGHRDGFNTECPGMKLYPQLPALRTLAAGPVQNLALTSVGGAAVPAEGGYESPGPVTLNWSTSTPSSLINRFEVLVDGAPVATAAPGARSTTATVPAGTHQVAVRAVHQSGRAAATAPVTVAVPHPKTFVPVTPERLMDTRSGLGVPKAKIGPGGVVTLQVTGTGGVPATGVGAVVLNVTATRVTGGSSYVSVYPNGTTRTAASNLNVAEGRSVANLVVVPVVNGKVDFYNNAHSIDLLADITGYYTTGATGSRHVNHGPLRVMDSRSGLGVPKAKVGPAQVVTLQVTGVNGVPAEGVTAVVLNVTATGATSAGYVSAYPNGTPRTAASTLNTIAGRTVPNLVIVPVVNGKVDFYNNAGSVDLLADITGYYTAAGEGARHYNAGPKRLMDTRTGLGVPKAKVGARGVVTLQVAGVEGVPANAGAVVLNVTATRVTGTSYISVYPDGTTRTSASNLNVVEGVTVPNLVIVPVVNGRVSFYNNAASVDLIADITGYFAP
ncbi:N-acetylmuramoyl-L-alanine amidase [Streptomyces sp. NPDC005805]|uniref:N-acetylmuramoyl-L-alanine amidase n=1 Tax=Streptomyces sp. NPDC005805 TaxID=3157068 RepID=UPI0033C78D72